MKTLGQLIVVPTLFVAIALSLSGCATCFNCMGAEKAGARTEQEFGKIYGGVQFELQGARTLRDGSAKGDVDVEKFLAGCLLIADFPLSAVGDTLTLPLTVSYTLKCQALARENEKNLVPSGPESLNTFCPRMYVSGTATNGNVAAAVECNGSNYIEGLQRWPDDVLGKDVIVLGYMDIRRITPEKLDEEYGSMVPTGALLSRSWLMNAQWKLKEDAHEFHDAVVN